MGLINKNFDSLTTSDLDDLIIVGMQEGILLEYKSALYGNGDSDVKEYLKDISSFANTSGGHLVIGLQETGGAPVATIRVAQAGLVAPAQLSYVGTEWRLH